MDKSDFVFVSECNGFEIRQNPILYTYRVFTPAFDGVFIADFETFQQAEEFCRESDVEYWENEIRSNQ